MENNWISVEDELPELNQEVLVYAYFHDGFEQEFPERRVLISNLRKWNSAVTDFDCNLQRVYNWKVTHWMPLPDVPEFSFTI